VDEYLTIPDELSRRRHLARMASSYLDKRDEAYVHLLDGGVSDNLALRGLIQMMAPTAEEAKLDLASLNKLRHVVIVSVDGQAEPDRQLSEVPYLDSLFRIIGAVTSTAIDRYGFETLIHAREMTRRLAVGLAQRDCPRDELGPTSCRMIDDHFGHVSLGDLADDERRSALAAIPTGLTIADPDVDALIAAGHDAVLCDKDMRDFFNSLPKVQMPPLPDRCRTYRAEERALKDSAPSSMTARASRADNP
jgi:NTE family protein